MAYGYVRDKEPLSINWAEISKNFNDRLAADEAERQSKRDDIQKQYDELSQELINKPTGADIDLNKAISSFSTQASQASLENLNKLKRGEISEQEYYNRRANLKSSTSNLFLYANNFNNQLQENLALIQSQDPDKQGSGGMAFQMALAQDMLNFKNTVAVIDPATDEVILVKTDEEGNPTNEIVNVAQLGYLSTQKEYAYNYKRKISDAIEGRGVAKYEKDGKTITTIQGAEINPKTATATVDALAESLVGDEAQQRSILYQNGYKYTQDESLKGKEGYIYYDINNNTYDFDNDAALELVKQDINNSIPVEIKSTMSEYQKANLKSQELTRLESIRQFEEKMKLEREKLNLLEGGQTESINSPLTIIRTTKGNDLAANDYIRNLDVNDFDSYTNKKDVVVDLQTILDTANLPNSQITYTKGGEDVTSPIPLTKDRLGLFENNPVGHNITGTSSNPTIRTKETIDIFVPGVMNAPVRIPITETIAEDVERLLTIIELKKLNKGIIATNELSFIPFNEYYNQGLQNEEEEVVVEDVTVGVDKIKNVINKTQNNNID